MMRITELPPFNPRLDDYRAEEFLAHTLTLLEYPIEQDQEALDAAPFLVKAPPKPPEPNIPLLPPVWYPKPTQDVFRLAPTLVQASRPPQFMGVAAEAAAERAMRPLLAGQGPITIQGGLGMGKTTLLRYIATHERTRQRFRRVWFFDDPQRVGQISAILMGLSHVLAQADIYRQFALLANELEDDTLLVIDNLSPEHPLLLACQTLSPCVLLGVETPPEPLETDTEGQEIIPEDPPGVITLRRLALEDGLNHLAQTAHLVERKGVPRELRPILEEIVMVAEATPFALTIIGSLMQADEIAPSDVLDYLKNAGGGGAAALDTCIETLPKEYVNLLEAFSWFSPLGVSATALASVLNVKNTLSLQRGLSTLKKRGLIRQDGRFKDQYIAAETVYDRFYAQAPHEPGKVSGERAREWIVNYFNEAAYEPAVLFAAESQLRHAYQIMNHYRLHDFAARLNARLSDYLRTYIPMLLTPDAPPPRLMGERAKAVQLARHGLELAERDGNFAEGREVLLSAIEELRVHGSHHDLAESMVLLGRLDDQRGDFGAAIKCLEEAARLLYEINAQESLSTVRLGLAMAYRHKGRLKDALGVLDDRPESEAERARIYREMGNLNAMMRALAASGADLSPYAKAESYLNAGHYADALAAIADDNSPQSEYLRALIYHLQGDFDHALMGYQQALNTFAPDNPERALVARAMAAIYVLQGDFDAAETTLTHSLEGLAKADSLQEGLTLSLLAAMHLRRGNNRTADETAAQALQKLLPGGDHADIADTYRVVGRACWRLERYPDALNAFLQEVEHVQSENERDETRIGLAFFHAAEAYRMTKQKDRAIANYRRALSHLDADEEAYKHLMGLSALHRALQESERLDDALKVNEETIAHLDRHPPPDLQHLGYMLAQNVRHYQRIEQHQRAYKSFARWLNTLTGRADALSDENRPLLALLAFTLATRSLLALGRPTEALPLAEAALSLAEDHIKRREWLPIAWAARRDLGEVLLALGEWARAHDTLDPLLHEKVKAEPHTYAAAYEGYGAALHELGDHNKALKQFWVALDHQPNPHKQGLIFERVANTSLALGDNSGAVENFKEAMKLLDRKAFPGVAARVLTTMAHTLAGMNRYADAIGVYEEALNMLRAVPDAAPLHTARVYASLGRSNQIQGQLVQATHAYQEALQIIEQHHVSAPDDYRDLLLRLARVLVMLQDYDAAIPHFERARDEAHSWGTQQEVGSITRELAEAERDGGYLARSLQTYRDGLELLPATLFPVDRAATLRSYGQALAQTQQFEQARKAWNEALIISQDAAPLEIALTHHAIGQAFRAQRDYPAAEEAFKEALQHHPKRTVEIAATLRELGETLLEAKRLDEAAPYLQQALEVERALPQQSNARLVKTLQCLGVVEEKRGERQNAITHYHAALVYMDRAFQPELYAQTLRTLGGLYAHRAAWDECQKALGEALEIEQFIKPLNEQRMALTLRMIADAYRAEGHLEKAASAYKKMANYENLSSEDAQKLRSTLDDLERHSATLAAALDSLMVLERTAAEPKDFAFVYALVVRSYFLLSQFDQSRTMMEKLVKLLNTHDFNPEDERRDYRSLAHFRAALQAEAHKDHPRARDHYRQALKDNSDAAMGWLIEQSMAAVM